MNFNKKDLYILSKDKIFPIPNFMYPFYAEPVSVVGKIRHRITSDTSNNCIVVLIGYMDFRIANFVKGIKLW